MYPKKVRVSDPELLEQVRQLWCLGCGQVPSDAHHVTPKGAGGDDVAENVMPLCRIHHGEWHQNPGKAISKYPAIRYWLELALREDILTRYGNEGDPPA
jgi:hypothetical protein